MMADRIRWTERTFDFNFPVGLHHELLARLRGTPARVEELVRAISPATLTRRAGDAWSIQENVGHLVNVEKLWRGRLDDYDANATTLRSADMSNRTTHEAQYNEQPLEAILGAFRRVRMGFVECLEQLEPDRFGQTALHPRLNQPMRIVDLLLFAAEHDDYHLTHMHALRRRFAPKKP